MTDNMERLRQLQAGQSLNMVGRDLLFSAELFELVERVLTRYGPLPLPGIEYYLYVMYRLRFSRDDLAYFVTAHLKDLDRLGVTYRTFAQAAAGVTPTVEAPHSYEQAYYRLRDMFALIREDPGLATAPLSMLEQMLRIDHESAFEKL